MAALQAAGAILPLNLTPYSVVLFLGFHETRNPFIVNNLQNPQNAHFLNRLSRSLSVTYNVQKVEFSDFTLLKRPFLPGFGAGLGSYLFCETPIARFCNLICENTLPFLNHSFSRFHIPCLLTTFHETRAHYETARTYST